jgi:hypothetical protein
MAGIAAPFLENGSPSAEGPGERCFTAFRARAPNRRPTTHAASWRRSGDETETNTCGLEVCGYVFHSTGCFDDLRLSSVLSREYVRIVVRL